MRARVFWVAAISAVMGLGATGTTADVAEGWHKSMDDGLEAAKKSGKPLLVITLWKQGV